MHQPSDLPKIPLALAVEAEAVLTLRPHRSARFQELLDHRDTAPLSSIEQRRLASRETSIDFTWFGSRFEDVWKCVKVSAVLKRVSCKWFDPRVTTFSLLGTASQSAYSSTSIGYFHAKSSVFVRCHVVHCSFCGKQDPGYMDPIQNMQKQRWKKRQTRIKGQQVPWGAILQFVCMFRVFFFRVWHMFFFCGKHNLQTKISHAKSGTKKQYNHPTSQYTIT